jgi:hypothetical protein
MVCHRITYGTVRERVISSLIVRKACQRQSQNVPETIDINPRKYLHYQVGNGLWAVPTLLVENYWLKTAC